jgi:uncharacterized protein
VKGLLVDDSGANRRTLDDVLQSTSDVLFPDELGERRVSLSSRDAEGDSPLHVLAWRSDDEGVGMLIDAGADVNAIGDMGETPLHVAIHRRCLPVAARLLRAGAQLDIRSEFGVTPLEMATEAGGEIAALLRAANVG